MCSDIKIQRNTSEIGPSRSQTLNQRIILSGHGAPCEHTSSEQPIKHYSTAELDTAVWAIACDLYDAGIRKGDSIIIQLPNITEKVIAFMAAYLLGAGVKELAIDVGGEALQQAAKQSHIKAYITLACYKTERFVSKHQSAFPDNTLIFAFGDTEPESAQLIGNQFADIEALHACQAYVEGQNNGMLPSDISSFPISFPLDLEDTVFQIPQ